MGGGGGCGYFVLERNLPSDSRISSCAAACRVDVSVALFATARVSLVTWAQEQARFRAHDFHTSVFFSGRPAASLGVLASKGVQRFHAAQAADGGSLLRVCRS